MSASQPVYLVTGAMGCIGAWTLYHLARQGKRAVAFDLSENRARLDLLMEQAEDAAADSALITQVRGDLTDPAQVLSVFGAHGITHVIHLAALQVPFCRANPAFGAQVNVTGTVNLFEAARLSGIQHVMYASSVAVYGPPEPGQVGQVLQEAPLQPMTLYGVYKVANEGTARIYWAEHGISSTALRPYTVYGVGRDQGMTSDPTRAMLAAAAGLPYHIQFNGPCQYHFASDVALQCIAAAERPLAGALAFNLGGQPVTSEEVIGLIREECPEAQITHQDAPLPFPAGFEGATFQRAFPDLTETPLREGVRQTIRQFRYLRSAGKIQA
jgi:nucleoside-diphosphate-sugar epimerase